MAPFTCQLLDIQGRGIQAVQVTLFCESPFSRKVLKFESLTDEDGGISMWFLSRLDNSGVTQMQPRVLDTSLLQDAQLTLFADSGRPTAPPNFVSTNLQLLSDALPAVVVHLGATPHVEYRSQVVASPVNEWCDVSHSADQLQAVSPLQLPAPLVQPGTAARPINSKRKRDNGTERVTEKRLRAAW